MSVLGKALRCIEAPPGMFLLFFFSKCPQKTFADESFAFSK